MTLSRIYCDEFLRDASRKRNRRQYAVQFTNEAGALLTGALAIFGASTGAVGLAGTGTASISALLNGYDSAMLADPDVPKLDKLVKAAQIDTGDKILDEFEAAKCDDNKDNRRECDISYAAQQLNKYTSLCTYNGISQLVNRSFTNETAKFNQPEPSKARIQELLHKLSEKDINTKKITDLPEDAKRLLAEQLDRAGCLDDKQTLQEGIDELEKALALEPRKKKDQISPLLLGKWVSDPYQRCE